MSRGMPGYARDAVGESPFAWSLEEALRGPGRPGGQGPGLLAVARRRRRLGDVPAVRDGPPGRTGRDRRQVLGRRRRPAAHGGRHRATAGARTGAHDPVHGRDELPADAHRGAVHRQARRLRPGGARRRHLRRRPRRGPAVPLAGPVSVALGHLAGPRPHREVVPPSRRPSRSAPAYSGVHDAGRDYRGCPTCQASPSAATPCSGSGWSRSPPTSCDWSRRRGTGAGLAVRPAHPAGPVQLARRGRADSRGPAPGCRTVASSETRELTTSSASTEDRSSQTGTVRRPGSRGGPSCRRGRAARCPCP